METLQFVYFINYEMNLDEKKFITDEIVIAFS